jgi:hypothetical protein
MICPATRRSIWFACVSLVAVALWAVSQKTAAGGKSAKVSLAVYKGIAIGAKFDDVEKMIGVGKRAYTKDVPKLSDPAEEKALTDTLKTTRVNLFYMWNSGTDRLVIGIRTADTGDVVAFKGFFWKEKGAQKGVFAAGK